MKRYPGLIALWGLVLLVSGCSSPPPGPLPVNTLPVSSVSAMLRSEKPPLVVDTRSPLEWRDEQLASSQCVPCDDPEKAEELLRENRNTPLVLYGRATISRETCSLLDRLTRERKEPVYVLAGGLPAWKKSGQETLSLERIPRLAVPEISSDQLAGYRVRAVPPLILDVRPAKAESSMAGVEHIPLSRLHERYGDIPLDRPVVVVDRNAGRGLLAASFLIRKGVQVFARYRGDIMVPKEARAKGGAGQ
jgi:rhodanese-related sulfurtransferase